MKVLHIIGGGDVGGAKTHVLSLIRALSTDAEVKLISLREGAFADDARKAGIDVLVIDRKNPFLFWKDIYKIFSGEGFEIVHCHGAKANLVGALLRCRRNVRVVTTVHSDYRLDYMGQPLKQCAFGLINAVSLRFFSGYTAVSDTMRDMLISRGFDPQRISVIYNGMDFLAPLNAVPRAEFLAGLGLDWDENAIICGVAARLTRVKDIKTLIESFAIASKDSKALRLLIAGEGEEKKRLEALAERLGVSGRICFAGWISDIDSLMNAVDISLLTSVSETFPYTVLEGVRAKCASVVTAVGGMPALIDDGIDGFLITPGDKEALADRLVRLAEDGMLRKRFADRLFDKAVRDFSLDAMKTTQLRIYDLLLKKSAKGLGEKKVMICGAYGRGNSGDDAILEAIIGTLRGLDDTLGICVLSRKPKATKLSMRVGSIYIFDVFRFMRELSSTKLFISGGGTLIQDTTSTRSLLFYLFTLLCAKKKGCRVMLYGCGIGPVKKKHNVRLTGRILNRCVDVITLREPLSLGVLRDFGVDMPEIVLSADPALGLAAADKEHTAIMFEREGIPTDISCICFALRRWRNFDRHIDIIAKTASYAYEKYGLTAVFIPMENPTDFAAIRPVESRLSTPSFVFKGKHTPSENIAILSRMRIVVGMRLHSVVFAASRGVEVIALAYDQKVSGFMEYMNQDLCVEMEELTFERLSSLVDTAASRLEEHAETLIENSRYLKEKEGLNGLYAAKLLEL